MPTKIVRLHLLAAGRIDVIERSEERLARAALAGGAVFDVTCDKAPWKPEALRLLRLAKLPVDPLADDAGLRARARAAVVPVDMPRVKRDGSVKQKDGGA